MSARINTMGVGEWKRKLTETQNDLEKFAHIINIDYWGTIEQADKFYDAHAAKQEMDLEVAKVFKSLASSKNIAEATQLEMLKLLFEKLPTEDQYGRTADYKSEGIQALKKNDRTEVATKFEAFCKNYKKPNYWYSGTPSNAQLKEILSNHNKTFHPELISASSEKPKQEEQPLHAAITSKKKTLITSENSAEPLKKDFNTLKRETQQYVSFIQTYAYQLHDLYKKDIEIASIKSKIDSNISEIIKANNEEILAPKLVESALLATKLIAFCEKHDLNTAKQLSKENVSILSKLIEHFKSFINKVQTQFTSKATLEKRRSNATYKNEQRQTTKENSETALKSLEKLLNEISTTPTLKKGS